MRHGPFLSKQQDKVQASMETPFAKLIRWTPALAAAALLGGAAYYIAPSLESPITVAYAAEGKAIAAPRYESGEAKGEQVAIFAGGCFWGIEGVYERVAGVTHVESGYAGGSKADADYDKVSDGRTAHAEAVRIVYDPAKVSYATLLHIFFSVAHDPTELNRQGPDTGPQYRSAIFPQNSGQRETAERYIQQLDAAKIWRQPIVTRIETGEFYPAEAYHQDYMANNPNSGYILRFDVPKVQALKRLFPNIYRAK
jgi:peptide-methionine (S)-S-oxide reductase